MNPGYFASTYLINNYLAEDYLPDIAVEESATLIVQDANHALVSDVFRLDLGIKVLNVQDASHKVVGGKPELSAPARVTPSVPIWGAGGFPFRKEFEYTVEDTVTIRARVTETIEFEVGEIVFEPPRMLEVEDWVSQRIQVRTSTKHKALNATYTHDYPLKIRMGVEEKIVLEKTKEFEFTESLRIKVSGWS